MSIQKYQEFAINTTGAPVKVLDQPTSIGKPVQVLIDGNVVGQASGVTVDSGTYEDGTIITWVEFLEDPYGYPPTRYVPSRYLTPHGNVVLPEVTVTAQPTSTGTNTGAGTTTSTPIKVTYEQLQASTQSEAYDSNPLVIGGVILAVVALIAAVFSKS
jgi:hypothetical protein